MQKFIFLIIIAIIIVTSIVIRGIRVNTKEQSPIVKTNNQLKKELHPLALEAMREVSYPGSEIKIEEELGSGSNYKQYITSYQSEGLKIYSLLTVPNGIKLTGGWPVIVFNHGYIPPEQYRTNERYIAYVAAFARDGYIVFKPDYRGNGNSSGKPEGAYYSPAYTVDVLNAVSSIKRLNNISGRLVDSSRIGMWGHSLGGNITLRSLEITPDIKAAVIWGGVVGSYDDLMNNWHRRVPFRPSNREFTLRNSGRQRLITQYGTPKDNPTFWNSIDPNYNVQLINAPVQLHHGESDEEVPVAFSRSLYDRLTNAHKIVELFTYPGADHNISSPSFEVAMERTVKFFDHYLKVD